MVSLITHAHFCVSQKPISHLNLPLVLKPNKLPQTRRGAVGLNLFVRREREFLGFLETGKGRISENSWCCCCKDRWGSEGDSDLEAEILEVMEKSSRPEVFPSEKDLVDAGRLDLVEAIKKRGGWFSLGWETEDEKSEGLGTDFVDIQEFQRRVESCKESGCMGEIEAESCSSSSTARNDYSTSNSPSTSQPALSSDASLKTGAENDSGVEGILSRLEKERNSSFGINLGKSGHGTPASSNDPGDYGTSRNVDGIDYGKNGSVTSGSPNRGELSNFGYNNSHYTKPDLWRSWSLQRAGFKETEFEAAEIPYDAHQMENRGAPQDEIITMAADATRGLDKWKESNHIQIQTRLQELETELTSALSSFRFRSEKSNSEEVLGSSSNDFQILSDAMEFQENEFMSAQERLRSIRAKLAVLEGKMTLAIMDAQKILEEKQMRIDSAGRSLEHLRTVSIVWPNSASEVFLAGSFDGWTTQRNMEKSRTGIFSVSLKLYPGQYEIKFIVDGVWKIDPLRPTVNNNGHENNIILIR